MPSVPKNTMLRVVKEESLSKDPFVAKRSANPVIAERVLEYDKTSRNEYGFSRDVRSTPDQSLSLFSKRSDPNKAIHIFKYILRPSRIILQFAIPILLVI